MSSSAAASVFDASAILALLQSEPGSALVSSNLPDGAISAVNVAEILTKLRDKNIAPERAEQALAGLRLHVVPLDEALARAVAWLRPITRIAGLSLADRACLALARHLGRPAVTADRNWAKVAQAAGVSLVLIR